MKYRITQLQGELNSMKYLNEQQRVRIRGLEQELSRGASHGESSDSSAQTSSSSAQTSSKETSGQASSNEASSQDSAAPSGTAEPLDLPPVSLQIIKDSRYQLTKSMKEVIHLLRSPVNTNIDYLDLPDVNDTNNSFDELFNGDKVDNFVFNGKREPKESYNSYFNSDQVEYDKSDAQSVASEAETVVLDGSSELSFGLGEQSESGPGSSLPTSLLDPSSKLLDPSSSLLPSSKTAQPESSTATGEIEPNLDKPDVTGTSAAGASTISSHTISLSSSSYEKVKVFNNPQNNLLIYINYDNVEDPEKVNVTIYDCQLKTQLLTLTTNNSFLDNVESLIDLYCMSCDGERARLVSVSRNGEVNQVVLDGEDSMCSTVLNLGVHELDIVSSGFVQFTNSAAGASGAGASGAGASGASSSTGATSSSSSTGASSSSTGTATFGVSTRYGLAVSLSKQPSFKVYELTPAPRNDLQVQELGTYTKGFFKNLKSDGQFEIVKWFKSEAPTTAPSPKKKTHKRSSSTTDPSLSPYQLVVKLDRTVFVFNIVLKQSTVLSNYCQDELGLEANTGDLVLSNVIDEKSYQLEVYDLERGGERGLITCNMPREGSYTSTSASTSAAGASDSSTGSTGPSSGTGTGTGPSSSSAGPSTSTLVSLSPTALSFYNPSHKLLTTKPVTQPVYRIGTSFGVQTKSSMTIYSV